MTQASPGLIAITKSDNHATGVSQRNTEPCSEHRSALACTGGDRGLNQPHGPSVGTSAIADPRINCIQVKPKFTKQKKNRTNRHIVNSNEGGSETIREGKNPSPPINRSHGQALMQ